MELTPAQTEAIRRRIGEFVLDRAPDPNGLRGAAARLESLPLFWDMGGCFALKPSGEIVSFSWDERDDLRVESDLRIRNVALFQGSKKYPELEALIVKPAGAASYPHCDGTGRGPTAAKLGLEDAIVCYCGGLGWLP